MANFTKILLRYCVPAVITVGLCYLLVREMDLRQMWETICTQCDFRWIAVNILLLIGAMWARAARWQLQLRALGIKASVWVLTLSVFGTYAVNLVFPRLGEVWRTGYIAHRQDAPFATVFGSMLADRLADMVTVILITVFTLFVARNALVEFVKSYPDAYNTLLQLLTSPWVWSVIIMLVIALIIVLRIPTHNAFLLKIKGIISELWSGFAAIAKMNEKGKWLLLTVLLWGTYYLELVIAFQAFPFTREIFATHGLTAVLVCYVLTSIAMGIPSNGGIGPYQIAMIFGLSLYAPSGLDRGASDLFLTNSTAFGNIVLGTQTILMIALGLYTFAVIAISRRRARSGHRA